MWRWINGGILNGATHMATDRAILEYINTSGRVVFRVYQWQPYCISLGFRQSEDSINYKKSVENTIDIVRRPTGGRAVFHAEEVTYSVIIPQSSQFFSSGIQKIYKMISKGLAGGIQKLGIPAELQKQKIDLNSHYQKSISVNCFSAAASSEVVVEGKKLIGSAQRHLSNGILQHGSILTGDKHVELPYYINNLSEAKMKSMIQHLKRKTISLGGYLNRSVSYKEVTEVIKRGIQEELKIKFYDDDLSREETVAAAKLVDEYSILSN